MNFGSLIRSQDSLKSSRQLCEELKGQRTKRNNKKTIEEKVKSQPAFQIEEEKKQLTFSIASKEIDKEEEFKLIDADDLFQNGKKEETFKDPMKEKQFVVKNDLIVPKSPLQQDDNSLCSDKRQAIVQRGIESPVFVSNMQSKDFDSKEIIENIEQRKSEFMKKGEMNKIKGCVKNL